MYRPFKTGSTNYNLIVNSDLVDVRLKHLRKFCTITDKKKLFKQNDTISVENTSVSVL